MAGDIFSKARLLGMAAYELAYGGNANGGNIAIASASYSSGIDIDGMTAIACKQDSAQINVTSCGLGAYQQTPGHVAFFPSLRTLPLAA